MNLFGAREVASHRRQIQKVNHPNVGRYIGLLRRSQNARSDCDIPFSLDEALFVGNRVAIGDGLEWHAEPVRNELADWLADAAQDANSNHSGAQRSCRRDLGSHKTPVKRLSGRAPAEIT